MSIGFHKPTDHSEDDQLWKLDGACRSADPETFFPTRGEMDLIAKAKRICNGCPVKDECLAYGMEEKFGVWGGTSEKERRGIRSQRRRLGALA